MIKCKGFIGRVTGCVKPGVAYIGIDTKINSFLKNNNIEIISIDKAINNDGTAYVLIFYKEIGE